MTVVENSYCIAGKQEEAFRASTLDGVLGEHSKCTGPTDTPSLEEEDLQTLAGMCSDSTRKLYDNDRLLVLSFP